MWFHLNAEKNLQDFLISVFVIPACVHISI